MYFNIILNELNTSKKILDIFCNNHANILAIQKAALLIVKTFKNGGKVLSCGNGGSSCDAMHFSEELLGRYRKNRIAYPALSISDISYISCVSNDFGYDFVFSRYIQAIGNKNDVLLAISTSGNSKNIVNAIKECIKKKIKVISLTGNDGGKVSKISDIDICVPYFGFSDRIQEIHIKIIHILVFLIEKEMKKLN